MARKTAQERIEEGLPAEGIMEDGTDFGFWYGWLTDAEIEETEQMLRALGRLDDERSE